MDLLILSFSSSLHHYHLISVIFSKKKSFLHSVFRSSFSISLYLFCFDFAFPLVLAFDGLPLVVRTKPKMKKNYIKISIKTRNEKWFLLSIGWFVCCSTRSNSMSKMETGKAELFRYRDSMHFPLFLIEPNEWSQFFPSIFRIIVHFYAFYSL